MVYETGVVYLVGAGPGETSLITWRGIRLLEQADVVVFDPAIPPAMLERCREDCLRIEGMHTAEEKDAFPRIHELLIDYAEEGMSVVRLYIGDPFVSGVGVEEAKALTRAGVPFEVVPGVPVGLAAATYAGIPLCPPGGASAFTFIRDTAKDSLKRYEAFIKSEGTLVFLTMADRLSQILRDLLRVGLSSRTWVAVIQGGGSPAERVIECTAAEAAEQEIGAGLSGAVVVVVGEVGRLRWELNWFEALPLHGRRILVTRPREQVEEMIQQLGGAGAEVIVVPTIRIAEPSDPRPLEKTLKRLGDYDWVLFTSANGVRFFADRLRALGLDARAFRRDCRLLVIGPGTAQALERTLFLQPDVVPERFQAEGVLDALENEDLRGRRILIPRAAQARELLPDNLRERGAIVDVVSAYQTLPTEAGAAERLRAELAAGEIDMVTFTSSSTVRHFVEMLGKELIAEAKIRVAVASIGPITSETAREMGLEVHLEAPVSTVPALVREIVDYYRFNPSLERGEPVPWKNND